MLCLRDFLTEIDFTAENILRAYAYGLFPMADSAGSSIVHWYCPEMRGQLAIHDLHIPRRLLKDVKRMVLGSKPYEIKINSAFKDVMSACAQTKKGREETWINQPIIDVYCDLHAQGHAHSVECWQDYQLIGGLYGISVGGAFFGESMFSHTRNASKITLVHLAARLWKAQYSILDTQFTNPHLEQFGVYEVPYNCYISSLQGCLNADCVFDFLVPNENLLIEQYLQYRFGPS